MMTQDSILFRAKRFDRSLRRKVEIIRAQSDAFTSERLERVRTPDYLRGINDLLVGTWRFADNAVRARVKAIEGGDSASAWEASSAAAGAMMMLSRVQSEIRDLIEPPRLK